MYKNLTKISGLKNAPVFLYETAFQDYHVFVFKWIEGKYVFLEKLSENGFRELVRAYLNFSEEINENPPVVVDPFYDMTKAVVSFKPPFFIKGHHRADNKVYILRFNKLGFFRQRLRYTHHAFYP